MSIYQCTICGETETRTTPATGCNHDKEGDLVLYYTEPASCTETGKKVYTCNTCKQEVVEIIPMKEHVSDTPEGKGFITVGAVKCVSDGAEQVECNVCHQTFTRPISAHKYETSKEIPATCTEPAKVVSKCKDCGVEKTEVKVAADGTKSEPNGHDFTKIEEKAATCLEDGVLAKVCKVCGYKEKEAIPALGHADEDAAYYYVTFDKDGKVETKTPISDYKPGMTSCQYAIARIFTCENEKDENGKAKEIVTVIADKKAHSIDTTKAVVTGIFECNDEGVITNFNVVNGKVTGLTNAVVDCEHAEAQVFTCKTCGLRQYNIVTPKKAHTKIATSEVVAQEPTCDVEGYTTYSCSTCHKTIKGSVLPKLTHAFVYNAASCKDETDAIIKCTNCAKTFTEEDIKGLATKKAADDAKEKEEEKTMTATEKEQFNIITKLLNEAKVSTTDLTTFTYEKWAHNFDNSSSKVENGLTYKHCNKCNKDIVVSLSIQSTPPEVSHQGETQDSKEKEVNERMGKVTITRKNNVVTITQNEKFANADKEHDNCIAIILDLGINAQNVDVVSCSAGTYTIEEGDRTCAKDWTSNANENQFIVWLAPSDFDDGSIDITFKDKSGKVEYPITITFEYKYAPGVEPVQE